VSDKKLVLLGTGGTIAGVGTQSGDQTVYAAAQLGVGQLLAALGGAFGGADRLEVEQVAQLDSKDMVASVWADLARRVASLLERDDVQGIVITHGTDTLEETAYFLHALLAPAKPVVLVCAMRPATALSADGPQNLLDALTVAAHESARGVLSVCAGSIHGPEDVQKVHPYRLDAMSSGDCGVIGFVEGGRVRQLRAWPEGRPRMHLMERINGPWPRVPVVLSHALAQAWMVQALVKQGAQGIVVACTGNGTIHEELLEALQAARMRGIKVVRSTRCSQGRLLPGPDDALPALPGLSPVKARIALCLQLLEEEQRGSVSQT